MGKKSKSKTDDGPKLSTPEVEAQKILSHTKSSGLPIYASTVNLGDDMGNLAKCLELIKSKVNEGQSVLLVSASETKVISGAFSNSDKVNAKDWVKTGLAMVSQKEGEENEDDFVFIKRVEVGSEAFAFKEKDTALSNSSVYINKTGILDEFESEDSEVGFTLNDLDD
jgi:hypothetical protein